MLLFGIVNATHTAHTLPQMIIKLKTPFPNVLIRILHHNEIYPLTMNLPPTTPDFHPPSHERRDTQEVIIGILSKSDSFLKKDQFPPMHFLIITLSCLQTIIWICYALFALPLSCIVHEQRQRFAGTRSSSGSVSEIESIHIQSLSTINNISSMIGFKVCLGAEEELRGSWRGSGRNN